MENKPTPVSAEAAPAFTAGHTKSRSDHAPCRLSILGATGSIGTSTLDLIAANPHDYELVTVSAHSRAQDLAAIARRHNAKRAVITDESQYQTLKDLLAGTEIDVAAGENALVEASSEPTDCVLAAIVGAAGLRPSFAALSATKRLALANKECLVCAGDVFMSEVERCGTEVLPVDSEHSAAFQGLIGSKSDTIEKITLTASGGPFRSWSKHALETATVTQALKHPNWSMGAKITIDSATMMNKGLELIEALHLFPVTPDQLDIVVHPQSIIHCLVAYRDGSVLAQLSEPDMRTPISLALAWPDRMETTTKRLDLAMIGELTFEAPDAIRFPALRIARDAMNRSGGAPTVLNAANEVAVAAFLGEKLRFGEIPVIVEKTLEAAEKEQLLGPVPDLENVLLLDQEARRLANMTISALC
jgi:1-deoxy-D-xylulose-5-phosphate reductoisomerase